MKKSLFAVASLLAATVMGVANVAAEKIKKEKLQVFIMLGQSNMVGLAQIQEISNQLGRHDEVDFPNVGWGKGVFAHV